MKFTSSELSRFVADIFHAAGMQVADAATLAETMVWADERGIGSHGVSRVPSYLANAKAGRFDFKARPETRRLAPATFLMECGKSAGPVCMMQAATECMAMAGQFGVGVGVLSDPSHVGAAGRYAQWIAQHGCLGIVMVAGLPLMAYHGAKSASVATSPVAIGIPGACPDGTIVLDMASSAIAAGRLRHLIVQGSAIPDGCAIDADGNATTDATRAATVLPLGGPKGSGLSLMFECLSGLLAGTPILAAALGGQRPSQNALMIVLNVSNFRPLGEYQADVGALTAYIKALPRREGFDEILLPGERGDRQAATSRCHGIPLPDSLAGELRQIGQQFGVAPLRAID